MAIPLELAETVREACLCTLFQAYESAGVSGLRAAGRWEIAVQALRSRDLRSVVAGFQRDTGNVT